MTLTGSHDNDMESYYGQWFWTRMYFKIQWVFWQASFSGLHFAADGKGWKPNVNIRESSDNFNIISSFPDRNMSLTNFIPLLSSHDQAVKWDRGCQNCQGTVKKEIRNKKEFLRRGGSETERLVRKRSET